MEITELGQGLHQPGPGLVCGAAGERSQREGSGGCGGLADGEIDSDIVEEAMGLAPSRCKEHQRLAASKMDSDASRYAGSSSSLQVVLVRVEASVPLAAEKCDAPVEAVHWGPGEGMQGGRGGRVEERYL